MPRRETPFVPNLYYHFYSRGNNRQSVFFEPENYLFFLRRFKEYVVPCVDVLAYCLMPTHYHILGRVKHQTSEVSRQVSLSIPLRMDWSPHRRIGYTRIISNGSVSAKAR